MGYTMNGAPFKHTDEHREREYHPPIVESGGFKKHYAGDSQIISAIVGNTGGLNQPSEPSTTIDVELTVNGEPVEPKSPMAMRRRRIHGRKRINRTK